MRASRGGRIRVGLAFDLGDLFAPQRLVDKDEQGASPRAGRLPEVVIT